jgi:hypothetical protein
MAQIVSAAGQPSLPVRRQFVVRQNDQGNWCTCERNGGIEHVFTTQREAIHFALYETGARCAAVSLTPPR